MKLLLTSAGITNDSIMATFSYLLGKDIAECTVAFVPTAANVEDDTLWMEEDIENLRDTGVKDIVMADIEKMPKRVWLPLMEQSQAIWFEGGNTFHLLYWVNKSGLREVLGRLLTDRLYVGVSAGSMIAGPDIKISRDIFPEEVDYEINDLTGLNYVNFSISPHFLSKYFTKARHEEIKEYAEKVKYPIYAIDDDTAISVIDGKVEVISEGEWERYN